MEFGLGTPPQSITLTNIGPGTASAIGGDEAGDVGDFPIARDTCSGATLAVDETCTITLSFAPTAIGDMVATFERFAHDADLIYPARVFGKSIEPRAPQPAPIATAPTPAPPAQPGSAPSPRLSAAQVSPTTRRTLLRRGLRFTEIFPGAGSVRWTLEIRQPSAHPAVVIARAKRLLTGARTVHMILPLTSDGRRSFTRRRPLKLVLRTTFTPAEATHATVVTTPMRLRR